MRRLSLCLALLTLTQLRVVWLRLRGPIALGAVHARREPRVAIELAGDGLACIPSGTAYARLCNERPCGTMSVARRLLIGAPLEPDRMSVRDWEALPGIGAKRAQTMLASALLPGGDLTKIRGLGAKTAMELKHRLGLDVEPLVDICSLGSWPTTSSGCGKQP